MVSRRTLNDDTPYTISKATKLLVTEADPVGEPPLIVRGNPSPSAWTLQEHFDNLPGRVQRAYGHEIHLCLFEVACWRQHYATPDGVKTMEIHTID